MDSSEDNGNLYYIYFLQEINETKELLRSICYDTYEKNVHRQVNAFKDFDICTKI